MGYEFWKPQGERGSCAIDVGRSATEFFAKSSISAKSKLSASGQTNRHGEARSAGYNVALHTAGVSHPVISPPSMQAYRKSGIGKRHQLNLFRRLNEEVVLAVRGSCSPLGGDSANCLAPRFADKLLAGKRLSRNRFGG